MRLTFRAAKDKPATVHLPYSLRFGMTFAEVKRRLKASKVTARTRKTALRVTPGKKFGWPHGAVRLTFDAKKRLRQVTAARTYPSKSAAKAAFEKLEKALDKILTSASDNVFGAGVRYDDIGHHTWIAVDAGVGFGKAAKRPSLVFVRTARRKPLAALARISHR